VPCAAIDRARTKRTVSSFLSVDRALKRTLEEEELCILALMAV